MLSQFQHSETLVEIFNTDMAAQAAVKELKDLGFSDSEIMVEPHFSHHTLQTEEELGSYAMSGAAAGLSLSAMWGLGILAGIAPDITAVVVAGFPGVVLTTAAAGAAVVGTGGAVLGRVHTPNMNVHHDDYEPRYTVVTVKAGERAEMASRVLNRFNGTERNPFQAM